VACLLSSDSRLLLARLCRKPFGKTCTSAPSGIDDPMSWLVAGVFMMRGDAAVDSR
jgi:hypothetical protein